MLSKSILKSMGAAALFSATLASGAHAGTIEVLAAHTPHLGIAVVQDGFKYIDDLSTSGNGFGAVKNLLTVKEPNDGHEDGQVVWNGSGDVYYSSDGTVATQSHKTATWSMGDLGVEHGDELVLAWNPSETGNDPGHTITDAILVFYSTLGTELLAIDLFADPLAMDDVVNAGLGGDGFAFTLWGAGLAAFDAMMLAAGDDAHTIRIGMWSELDGVDNGHDTWTVNFKPGAANEDCHDRGNCPVPEPGPLGLLGGGMLVLYFVRRQRFLK